MRRLASLLLLLALGVSPAFADPQLKLERVVLLLRHGVRPPTHEPALAPAIAPETWPVWEVPDGYLTPHGAAAISLLAAYDARLWAPLHAGCGDIVIYADVDERTLATGAAYAAGFAPGCAIKVLHAAQKPDPIFSTMDAGAKNFNAKAAKAQMLAAAGGSPQNFVAAHAALYQAMQNVLQPGGTAYLALPAKISARIPGHLPKLTGPVAEGASGAEDFLLEYLDGKPMGKVAWGRADAQEVLALLALHPLAYTITARPAMIAQATARPLAARIVAGLEQGPALTVLVGHDTNQAELGGLLGLHWHLAGYPADDPPPGGGIIFALWRDGTGQDYVTATYQAQTPEQIRNLTPLNTVQQPVLEPLPILGCGNAAAVTACPLKIFTKMFGS